MFFVEKPYISDFFKATIRDNAIPVVRTPAAEGLNLYEGTRFINEDKACELLGTPTPPPIYTTSENAIGWIAAHAGNSPLPGQIESFKNKVRFRELTASVFPDLFFKAVPFTDLKTFSIDGLPLPFIIKPAVGFFSMGVHKVSDPGQWQAAVDAIHAEIDQVSHLYPPEVMNAESFIIEQVINGEEFAVDAYFDEAGEPVILGIFQHMFASDTDVSDRVYLTSKQIIEDNLAVFSSFARKIGTATSVKNFPVHMELRRTTQGDIYPIEVNPMRFGGWCTTADLTFKAFGFNPYLSYYTRQKPDWAAVLKQTSDHIFSIIVLDNSTGMPCDQIRQFDYDALLAQFETPLALRKIDFHEYPVFGFLFTKTRKDNILELKHIVNSDLKEFITTSR